MTRVYRKNEWLYKYKIAVPLLKMIRVYDMSGHLLCSDTCPVKLWDMATNIKRKFGFSRGEQTFVNGDEILSKSTTLTNAMEITLVRSDVVKCSGCGKIQRKRKLKCCGICLDAYYCNESCQKGHWKCRQNTCASGVKNKPEDVDHEHDYQKIFPNGPRDNNEFDLICKICGHIA